MVAQATLRSMVQRKEHIPVLRQAAVEGLVTDADGIYVDATFGSGGHSRAILALLKNGRLIAFDHDEQAASHQPDDDRCTLILQNFRYMRRWLDYLGIRRVHGILADLGISSTQLDAPERGFSFQQSAPLDMRMDHRLTRTAADILNQASANELLQLFGTYGEVRNAKTLVRTLEAARKKAAIQSSDQLVQILSGCIRGNRARYLAQVFQALRIAVNDELGALQAFLPQCSESLRTGGRLVVISYHSLEDRIVKNFMRHGTLPGDEATQRVPPFRMLTKKPIVPTLQEVVDNPRARSAKLRIAEKV